MPKTIGVFGQRHLWYLREYLKVTYTNLLTNGRLYAYLAEIDRQACAMEIVNKEIIFA